jgi:hypothetical protein
VFIDDAGFKKLWLEPECRYLVASPAAAARLKGLVGETLHLVAESGGKLLLTNHPLAAPSVFELRPPSASAPEPRPSQTQSRGGRIEPTHAVVSLLHAILPEQRNFGASFLMQDWT